MEGGVVFLDEQKNVPQSIIFPAKGNDFMLSCAFTGPRPQSAPHIFSDFTKLLIIKSNIAANIINLADKGVKRFYTGMALGGDMLFAEAVIKLKPMYSDIKLYAAIPFSGQSDKYSCAQKERYQILLDKCDKVEVLSENYFSGCYLDRNRYMVDKCQYLVALCGKDNIPFKGGTGYTVKYAQKTGREIIFLL